MGKDWKSCKLDEIGHSKPLQWEKIAKVATKTKSNFPYIVGGRKASSPSTSPAQSSEVERNPKMSILFFWLERGGGWGLSPSTSPANHQKLNVIQKQAFNFFDWRGVVDGV